MKYIKPAFFALIIAAFVQFAYYMLAKDFVVSGVVVHWNSFSAVGFFVWFAAFIAMTRLPVGH